MAASEHPDRHVEGHLERLFGLRGRVALVIGASSGLGLEAARALAGAGADVAIMARREDRLREAAAGIEALGVRCHPVAGDATDRATLERAVAEVEETLGPVWVLVYAAGIAPLRRAEAHSREDWLRAIDVNLTGAFDAAQVAGSRMIERGEGGRLVMLSSAVGLAGNPVHRLVGYAASKGGLNQLVRQLAVEWAKHGITVNAIAPAYFRTEMTVDPRTGDVPDEMRARMELFTPMGRLGNEGETESAICFLAAPASSYVTGVILPVDGGWTAW